MIMPDREIKKPKLLERAPEARHKLGEIATTGYNGEELQKIVKGLGHTYVDKRLKESDVIVGSVNHLLRLLDVNGIDPSASDSDSIRQAMIEKVGVERVPIGVVPDEFRDQPIEDDFLETRPYKALKKCGINTNGELGNLSVSQLGTMPNIGVVSIEQIIDFMAFQGWLIPELLPEGFDPQTDTRVRQ